MSIPDEKMVQEKKIVENASSTFSIVTAQSKPWPAVVLLGEKILNQLGLSESNDILTRWVAHRIAELIERSNTEENLTVRAQLQLECTELIFQLWERRRQWPEGGPLNRVMSILEKVGAQDKYSYWKQRPFPIPWIEALNELQEVHAAEIDVCWQAIFSQVDQDELAAEITAAEAVFEALNDEEKESLSLLKFVRSQVEEAKAYVGENSYDLDFHFKADLSTLFEQRRVLFDAVRAGPLSLSDLLNEGVFEESLDEDDIESEDEETDESEDAFQSGHGV